MAKRTTVEQLQAQLREHAQAVRAIRGDVERILGQLKAQLGLRAELIRCDALEASRGEISGGGLIGAARDLERAAAWTPKRVAVEQAERDRIDAAEKATRASRRAA